MGVAGVAVFTAVVLARFLAPLAIPRYPLPGILAALALDAIDRTIFEQFATGALAGYQSYDKALDVYYLAIAYIATLRNWTSVMAFEVGRVLWYLRLVGVTAFELTAWRPLLVIFPNTFEYFFIVMSVIRLRWSPHRLARHTIVGLAAFLWIAIKLPQETWIHILEMDTTDVIKEHVLGMPLDASWRSAVAANLWVIPVLAVAAAVVVTLAGVIARRLPPADWRLSFGTRMDITIPIDPRAPGRRQPRAWLVEKVVLVGLVTVTFAETLPGVDTSVIQVMGGVTFVIVANSLVSYQLAERGARWRSTLTEMATMTIVNFIIATIYLTLVPFVDGDAASIRVLFFTVLLTLIVTLYDHYRPIHDWHAAEAARGRTQLVAAVAPQR